VYLALKGVGARARASIELMIMSCCCYRARRLKLRGGSTNLLQDLEEEEQEEEEEEVCGNVSQLSGLATSETNFWLLRVEFVWLNLTAATQQRSKNMKYQIFNVKPTTTSRLSLFTDSKYILSAKL
jgi:hypothetical protein